MIKSSNPEFYFTENREARKGELDVKLYILYTEGENNEQNE